MPGREDPGHEQIFQSFSGSTTGDSYGVEIIFGVGYLAARQLVGGVWIDQADLQYPGDGGVLFAIENLAQNILGRTLF